MSGAAIIGIAVLYLWARRLYERGDLLRWGATTAVVLIVIESLLGASLVLLNGAGYSGWLDKVSLKSDSLVPTSEALRDNWIALEDQVTHSHGPGGEHAHAGYAFTTWMDMSLARVQAESVAAALVSRWPERDGRGIAPPRCQDPNAGGIPMKRFAIVAAALMIAAAPALGVTVRVECHGEVEYNQINSGVFGGVAQARCADRRALVGPEASAR